MQLPPSGKAALFVQPNQPFQLKEYPISLPQKGEALLKISASGVCGTDVHIWKGRLPQNAPLVIGHEFLGEIIALPEEGDNCGLRVGDQVIYVAAIPCGKCLLCRTGDSANCVNFRVSFARDPEEPPHFFGGFAQYSYAPLGNLIRLPEGVDPLTAAAFPCAGPTDIHALKLGGFLQDCAQKVDTAVVQGLGPVGLFAVLWLASQGVRNVVAVVRGTSPVRMEYAKAFGATAVVTTDEAEEYVRSVSREGLGADLAVEASGNPKAFVQGLSLLRNRGTYLVPGQYSNSGSVALEPQTITFKALNIIGSSQYDASDVADYVSFLDQNRQYLPQIRKIIAAYPLEKVNEAMTAAEQLTAGKVVLTF